MDDIGETLVKVRFPASRQELVAAARDADAPGAMIARLEALGSERYDSIESVRRALMARRAESNPSLVAIVAEVCERCGFPRAPGEPHSCVEEKARFADSVQAVTDEFDRIDENANRPPAGEH